MDAIILMMSDTYGQYIPQNFIRDVDRELWHVSPENAAILDTGPDAEYYWETWDDVLGSAYYVDGNNKYTLYQDGDLWAICSELMSNAEYSDFFGEMKPAPDGAEYGFSNEQCECCGALPGDRYRVICMGDK